VQALGIDRRKATRLLSQWTGQGWLTRVGPGLYVPVPLDLAGNEQVMADPWILVPTLFGQCYIGGWTAAHHWELTEQLFNDGVRPSILRRLPDRRKSSYNVVYRRQRILVFTNQVPWQPLLR
jgi:predicted transcriptional regulator of viral defense system